MLGTLRDRRSMSAMVNSRPALCATARMCNTVLVEPPMAMSSVMAFSKACEGRDAAREHVVVALLVVALGHLDDAAAGSLEELPAIGMRGQQRAVSRQGEPERFGQAVHASWR